MKTLILIIYLSACLLVQCNPKGNSSIDRAECERLSTKTQELINNYLFFDEGRSYARLDSALVIIDSISGKCGEYNSNISLRKLVILLLKQEYSQAVKYAELLSDSIVSPDYKSLIIDRFKAMEAQANGDTILKNQLLRTIISNLKYKLPKHEIDSVLQLKDANSIMKYEKIVPLMQYYYYRAQLEGVDKICIELDSLQRNWDDSFYDSPLKPKMEDNFMVFNGI